MAEQPNQRRWNDSVSDLPAFHGNEKDTITAESITTRVEAAAEALTWDDAATFNNFSLAMRSNAEKWLTLQADIRPDFAKSWIYIKPLFREAFGSKMDESKVFLTIKELGHKPTELVRDYAIRFNENYRTIKTLMKPKIINIPANEADRTVAVCQNIYAQGFADAQMEVQKILFVATLDMPLLKKVVQKEIPTFVDAMEIATKIQGLTMKPNGNGGVVHRIQEDNCESTDAEFVNQIQQGYSNNRGNNRGRGNRGQSRGNRGNRGHFSGGYYNNKGNNGNNGNNGNGTTSKSKESAKVDLNTKIKCLFCKIIGHHQDECRKRIEAGKPCQAASGKEYFPKSKQYPVTEEELDADMGQSGEYQSAIRENKSEYLFQ